MVLVLWHMCMVMSRILALSFFSYVHGALVFVVVGMHWAAMFFMLVVSRIACSGQKRAHSSEPPKRWFTELPFETVISFGYIFVFFTMKHNRICTSVDALHLVIFYLLTWLQNIAMVMLFFVQKQDLWYALGSLPLVIGLPLMGLLSFLVYHTVLNPTKMHLGRCADVCCYGQAAGRRSIDMAVPTQYRRDLVTSESVYNSVLHRCVDSHHHTICSTSPEVGSLLPEALATMSHPPGLSSPLFGPQSTLPTTVSELSSPDLNPEVTVSIRCNNSPTESSTQLPCSTGKGSEEESKLAPTINVCGLSTDNSVASSKTALSHAKKMESELCEHGCGPAAIGASSTATDLSLCLATASERHSFHSIPVPSQFRLLEDSKLMCNKNHTYGGYGKANHHHTQIGAGLAGSKMDHEKVQEYQTTGKSHNIKSNTSNSPNEAIGNKVAYSPRRTRTAARNIGNWRNTIALSHFSGSQRNYTTDPQGAHNFKSSRKDITVTPPALPRVERSLAIPKGMAIHKGLTMITKPVLLNAPTSCKAMTIPRTYFGLQATTPSAHHTIVSQQHVIATPLPLVANHRGYQQPLSPYSHDLIPSTRTATVSRPSSFGYSVHEDNDYDVDMPLWLGEPPSTRRCHVFKIPPQNASVSEV